MDGGLNDDYAPKSPDLTPVDTSNPPELDLHPQHQQYRGSLSHIRIPLTPGGQLVINSPWSSISRQGGFTYPDPRLPHIQTQLPNSAQAQLVSSPTSYFNLPSADMGRRTTKKEFGDEAICNVTVDPADIEVKTKFPVARIKRIMQADEEVGKVAQVTPVAVCKSIPSISGKSDYPFLPRIPTNKSMTDTPPQPKPSNSS